MSTNQVGTMTFKNTSTSALEILISNPGKSERKVITLGPGQISRVSLSLGDSWTVQTMAPNALGTTATTTLSSMTPPTVTGDNRTTGTPSQLD